MLAPRFLTASSEIESVGRLGTLGNSPKMNTWTGKDVQAEVWSHSLAGVRCPGLILILANVPRQAPGLAPGHCQNNKSSFASRSGVPFGSDRPGKPPGAARRPPTPDTAANPCKVGQIPTG
jgi:hypothetical protein